MNLFHNVWFPSYKCGVITFWSEVPNKPINPWRPIDVGRNPKFKPSGVELGDDGAETGEAAIFISAEILNSNLQTHRRGCISLETDIWNGLHRFTIGLHELAHEILNYIGCRPRDRYFLQRDL